jgi:hypothetical protein
MKASAWVRALIASNLLTFAVLAGCGYFLATEAAAAPILGAVVATLGAAMFVLNLLTVRLANGNWEEDAPQPAAEPRKRRPRKTASSVTWRADWDRTAARTNAAKSLN